MDAMEITAKKDTTDAQKLVGLGSPFNQILLFAYLFFSTALTTASIVVGLTWYVTHWKLSIVWNYNTSGLTFLATTAAEFIVSTYADKSEGKYGRRKPYVAVGYVVQAIGALMVCIPPSTTSGTFVTFWFVATSIIGSIGRGISANPYQSWIIEGCVDNAEYRAYQSFTATFGQFLGGLFGGLLGTISPPIASVISAVAGGIATFLIVWYVPTVVHRQVAALPPLIPSMRIASRTNEFRTIFTNRVLIGSATGIFSSSAALLLLIGFNITSNQSYVIYVILIAVIATLAGLSINAAMNWVLKFFEKLRVYLILAVAVALFSSAGFIASLFSNGTAFIFFLIFDIILASIYFPIVLIESLMVRDLIVYDTFTTGAKF